MNKIFVLLVVLALIGGTSAVFVGNNNVPDDEITSVDKGVSKVENVYETPYLPAKVSYWEFVQRIVNQGVEAVQSEWAVGDVFVDNFNDSSVMVTLVDIAEDGTCTFMMDSVLEQTLTYSVITYDINEYEIDLDYLYSDDENGNRTWIPLVIRGEIGEYYLVLYEPPEDQFLMEYHWKANGMYEPDWTYTEAFDFNVEYSMIALGTTFDDSIFKGNPYYLLEFNVDSEFIMYDWIDVEPNYAACVSDDLLKYAADFRLPFAEELGIGDLEGNGANQTIVWDYFSEHYSFDDNGIGVTDQTVYNVYNFDGIGPVEKDMKYTSFKGEFFNFWLEDTATPELGHPSRFYVDESGKLLLIDTYMPLDEPIYGSFRPCFMIKPQQ